MLVVTLITIEVGCTSFSQPLDGDEMDGNNDTGPDENKLKGQSGDPASAQHLRAFWADPSVCEGLCVADLSTEEGDRRPSASDSPSGSGRDSGTFSGHCSKHVQGLATQTDAGRADLSNPACPTH